MSEKNYDRLFYIKTTGIREWKDNTIHYNRCEATPYKALDKLFKVYKFKKTDRVVDFGCGRGRVAFYIHNRFHVPVTGIEMNDKTYKEAINNKVSYRQRAKHISAPIRFEYGLAEHYEVKLRDNRFYFFNPFSVQIFKKVVNNILCSVNNEKRPVDIILYHPMPKYKQFLKKDTPFKLLNKVRVSEEKTSDRNEKFLIYRFGQNAIKN